MQYLVNPSSNPYNTFMKVTSIILAGGKNTRLGKNKALEIIGGKTVIERVIERLRPVSNQLLIVTSSETNHFPGAGDAEILTDLYPGYGPLGGIYTGLVKARSRYSLAVACDMPFLNTELLKYMIEQAHGVDVVVPCLDGGMIESLHSIYSSGCLPSVKACLDKKQLSIERCIRPLNVRYVAQTETQAIDPRMLSFFNINYPSDLEKANAIATEETVHKGI